MLFESMGQGFSMVQMLDGAGAPPTFRILEVNAMAYQHTGLSGAVGKLCVSSHPMAKAAETRAHCPGGFTGRWCI
jgi:hypothetical protein